MTMNAEIKAKWTAALRSGDYQQGKGSLNDQGKFCCLGVLCDLAVKDEVIGAPVIDEYGTASYADNTAYLPAEVMEWAGVERADPSAGSFRLSWLNDDGAPFADIADRIDANL